MRLADFIFISGADAAAAGEKHYLLSHLEPGRDADVVTDIPSRLEI